MATYTKTIGASGADYTSLAAWQTARLAAAEAGSGDTEEAVLLDGDYSGSWDLSTSWPSGVTVRLKGQNSHNLDWEVAGGGAQLTAGRFSSCLNISGTYESGVVLEIVDLVVQAHPSNTFISAIRINGNATLKIARSLVRGQDVNGNYGIRVVNAITSSITIENSIVLGGGTTYQAIYAAFQAGMVCPITARGSYIGTILAGQASGQVIDITLDGCLIPARPTDGSAKTATECITGSANWTGWTATGCSSGVSFVDADPSAGQVAFVDRTGWDYRLRDHADNLAIDFCSTADMPADDILGSTRDATPDCGAFEVVVVGSAPDAPTDFVDGAATSTALTFSWTDVATDEDNYEVEYKEESSGTWLEWDYAVPADAETDTITGLTPETVYDIRVRATNDFGDSSWLTGQMTTAAVPSTARRLAGGMGMGMGMARIAGAGAVSGGGELLWSAASSWAGGVPEAGEDVTIPLGTTIVLDTDTAALGVLTIEGALVVQPGSTTSLTANTVMVDGGVFQCGTEPSPFTGSFTLTLTGATPSHTTDGEDGSKLNNGMSRGLMVTNGGVLDLHGVAPDVYFTRIGDHIDVSVDDNTIALSEAVDWPVGSKFILSKTDYYRIGNTEELTIAARPNSTTITTVENIATDRWGVMQYVTDSGMSLTAGTLTKNDPDTPSTLDERATVALLTRNIVIQGANDTTWSTDGIGGHTMVDDNTCTYRLQNVEFRRMGQKHSKGRYPIHFHMLSWGSYGTAESGDWLGEAPADRFYANGCSVAGSMNRAVVIHGTHGILVEDCIAFDIKGHAFFEEDGAEQDNIIQRNCAMKVRDPGSGFRIKTNDQEASGFWLVNPNNKIRHNIASDCDGRGFWNSFNDVPLGLSRQVSVEPRFIVVDEFDDNIAHSNVKQGFNTADVMANEDGSGTQKRYLERYTGGQVHSFTMERNQSWKNSTNGYENRVMRGLYNHWTMADNESVGSVANPSSDFFGSSLLIAKNTGPLLVHTSLNNSTAKGSSVHNAVASYHFEMDFIDLVAVGYQLETPTIWSNGQMVQGGGVLNGGDLYTHGVNWQMGRSPGWTLIDSHPGLPQVSAYFDGFALGGWGSGGAYYRYWSLGVTHDPYGYWGAAGHWIVPDRDLYTYGLTTYSLSGLTSHVGIAASVYGLSFSINAGHAEMTWNRLDTSNTSIDSHVLGDPALSAMFSNMRRMTANRAGRFRLELPSIAVADLDSLYISVELGHHTDEWFLVGVPWDGTNTPTMRVTGAGATTRTITASGSSIADVLADTTGQTAWRDTANDMLWLKYRGVGTTPIDPAGPFTLENNHSNTVYNTLEILR